MDSITKLRGKLSEAESLLQYVSKELEGYARTDRKTRLNFAELKLRGEQYSFYEHPLKGQLFQDDYLALMIYLISLGGKKEEGWTVLYRIAAGCDYQGELQNLATDAMTFTEERLSDLIREIYLAGLANIFAIDSLMISHHMGADDAQLKFLAGVYELLKLDKAFLTEAMEFVKVLDTTFWDNLVNKCKTWKFLSAKDMATYIGGYPAASLEEAAKLNYNRIVISGITYTGEDVLKLDDWKANEILFIRCSFENCGGIYSTKKNVTFIDCSFLGNIKRYADDHTYSRLANLVWTDKKYSPYRGFLHVLNTLFIKCNFKSYNDAVPLIYLKSGLIQSCDFENCHLEENGSMLINVNDSEVTMNNFFSNHSYRSLCSRNVHVCCLMYSSFSKINRNNFSSCDVRIYDQDPNHCGDAYLIILDQGSVCRQNSFANINLSCTCINGCGGRSTSTKTTIGIYNSDVGDNEGEISTRNISKPNGIFYVGNVNHENQR